MILDILLHLAYKIPLYRKIDKLLMRYVWGIRNYKPRNTKGRYTDTYQIPHLFNH